MKTITADKARKILRKQYPQLKHIWIFDKKLVVLSDEQVDKILQGISVYEQRFKVELFDCDDFALVANAFVKLETSQAALSHPWAFGECSFVHPERGAHNQNIFITEGLKVKLYEPQNQEITLPDGEIVFYVRM